MKKITLSDFVRNPAKKGGDPRVSGRSVETTLGRAERNHPYLRPRVRIVLEHQWTSAVTLTNCRVQKYFYELRSHKVLVF